MRNDWASFPYKRGSESILTPHAVALLLREIAKAGPADTESAAALIAKLPTRQLHALRSSYRSLRDEDMVMIPKVVGIDWGEALKMAEDARTPHKKKRS